MEENNKLTRIQQIYERGPTLVEQIYEGSAIMKVREYIKRLKAVGFIIYDDRGKGGHRRAEHENYPHLNTTISKQDGEDMVKKMISEWKYFKSEILRLDKENNIERSKKAKKYLREAYMNNTNLDVVNEFDNPSMADVKKEFKDKYGMDATKEFYVEELEDIRDIQYHGKHKGYKIFTYINEDNEIVGRCPVLGVDVGENFIEKKGIDPVVKEVKYVMDWFISSIRENGGVYQSPFLDKKIKV